MINIHQKRIIISKTNQIGDVTFSLPLASALKKIDPTCVILLMGKTYTQSLVSFYPDIDEFIPWEKIIESSGDAAQKLADYKADIIIHVYPRRDIAQLAKKAGISIRLGNSRRLYHWMTCNRFTYVRSSGSNLHETQLDMKFLKRFGVKKIFSLKEISALRAFKSGSVAEKNPFLNLLDPHRFNLILHPKTRGQHIEWSFENFSRLVELLPDEKFKIFVTGSEEEGKLIRSSLMARHFDRLNDLTGKMSLEELMTFIAKANGLIAASTGPVHLAANLGIHTLGLYAPIRPFHAGRWGPVGEKAEILCVNKNCEACRYSQCHCINEITPEEVSAVLFRWLNSSKNSNELVRIQ